jgi:hypothetical protein
MMPYAFAKGMPLVFNIEKECKINTNLCAFKFSKLFNLIIFFIKSLDIYQP